MDSDKDKKIKDETLKKDFRVGQYIYVAIYVLLIICLVVFFG